MLALSLFALCGVAFAQDVTHTEDVTIKSSPNFWSNGPRTITCQENLIIRKSASGIVGNLSIGRKVIVEVYKNLNIYSEAGFSNAILNMNMGVTQDLATEAFDNQNELHVYGTLSMNSYATFRTANTYATIRKMEVAPGAVLSFTRNSRIVVDELTLSSAVNVDATSLFKVHQKLIIPAGAIVDITGVTLNAGAELVIGEGAIVKGIPSQQTFNINLSAGQWNFVGFPHATDISPLVGENMPMVWAVDYDYSANAWSTDFMHYNEETQGQLEKGKGIFVWTEENATISVTELRDEQTISLTYPGNASNGERWFALSNPYSKSLDIKKFIQDQDNVNSIHGGGNSGRVYKYTGTAFQALSSGEIKPGEGFFICMSNNARFNSITFDFFNQYYVSSSAESVAANESMTISVLTDGYAVPVEFLQNDAATVGFDEFDAPKMFGNGFVAEPYLVSDGKNLCAEVVNASSYTATMNIKSNEARTVQIVASNIPEGYSLVLKDNENEIAMSEGDVYTTEIANGENADRFKLLINQTNASITDAENVSNLSVMNVNRNITISGEKNVRTEVYNTLGQKVFETEESNFELNTVPAGAYVVKVQGSKSVKSQKIIIE